MISGVAWPSLFDSHFKTLFLFFNFRSTRAITGTSIVLFTKAFSKECGSYKFPTGPGVVVKGNAEKLVQHFRDYIGNKSTKVTEVLQKTTQETEVQYKNSKTIVFKLQSVFSNASSGWSGSV